MLPNLCRSFDAPMTATVFMFPDYGIGLRRAPVQLALVRRPVLTLLLLSGLTFFLGLGRPAITDSDEALLRGGVARDGGGRRLAHAALQLRGSLAEAHPLLLDLPPQRSCWVDPTEFMARASAALSGVGLVLVTWASARRLTQRDERRMDRRRDRRHLLWIFRHGAVRASGSAARLLHHGDHLGRSPGRRRPRSLSRTVVDADGFAPRASGFSRRDLWAWSFRPSCSARSGGGNAAP